jgi:hypothetical protein
MLHFGFDALVPNTDGTEFDFDNFETSNGFKIPNSYKLFAELFKTGEGSLKHECVWKEEKGLKSPLLHYGYQKDGVEFALIDFFTIKETLAFASEAEKSKMMIQIMPTIDRGGGVYIGIKEDNFGKVYVYWWDMCPAPIFLADDIFQFVKGITCIMWNQDNIQPKQLYKNWGEDFWRIREE